MEVIVGKFNMTGVNEIDIDLVVNDWSHLWVISEWRRDNSWRLIKSLRKDSEITKVKTTISSEQAQELINKLKLISLNGIFNSGFTWRREKDFKYLENWRREKMFNRF